jgi:magnesium transporter
MDTKKTFDEALEEILDLVKEKKYKRTREMLLTLNEADIAEILEEILEEVGMDAALVVFRMLPKDISADVFARLPSEEQLNLINSITHRELTFIIDELDFDDKIDVLEELPANLVDKILEKTPRDERRKINTFLNYPENCAGTLMTPDYISLQKEMTVKEALSHIKKEGMDSETIYTCYVKDRGRKLLGIVSLRALVIGESTALVSDLMQEDFISVNVYDDQEDVSDTFRKYGYLAIPVVDNEQRLVGIITFDDILDVIEEETTEDMSRMAGVMDTPDARYLSTSVLQHVRSRFPWLIFLTMSYMITSLIITQFEYTLATIPILVAYMPLLMGTGGNTGAQASTLIIRGMALGDVELKDAVKVLWKELRISILVGTLLGAFNFGKVTLIDGQSWLTALTISISLLLVVVFAKIVGGTLPMAAKKCKIDPALMANPVIASITDMFSATIYLLLATLILGI